VLRIRRRLAGVAATVQNKSLIFVSSSAVLKVKGGLNARFGLPILHESNCDIVLNYGITVRYSIFVRKFRTL
jgi:hypothetical protein